MDSEDRAGLYITVIFHLLVIIVLLICQISAALKRENSFVLDFSKVEYMASAGLRAVVAANKKAKSLNATFAVVGVAPGVMSIFRMTGIDKKLNITEAK